MALAYLANFLGGTGVSRQCPRSLCERHECLYINADQRVRKLILLRPSGATWIRKNPLPHGFPIDGLRRAAAPPVATFRGPVRTESGGGKARIQRVFFGYNKPCRVKLAVFRLESRNYVVWEFQFHRRNAIGV